MQRLSKFFLAILAITWLAGASPAHTGAYGFLKTDAGFIPIDPRANSSFAYGINTAGQIVGFYFTPSPVPGTVLLLGSGLLGLMSWRRFNKH